MTHKPGDGTFFLDTVSLVQAKVSNAQNILSALERAPDHLKRKKHTRICLHKAHYPSQNNGPLSLN